MNYLFGAEWCVACKQVKPQLEAMGVEFTYVDIDSDEGIELAGSFRVRSVPTFHNGTVAATGVAAIVNLAKQV